MESGKDLGPCMIRWNMESVVADIVTMTIIPDGKKLPYPQYLEICLKYKKRVKVKKIPFFTSFIQELKNPKSAFVSIKHLYSKGKKLETLIVTPVQPIRIEKNKKFYFGGHALWRLI